MNILKLFRKRKLQRPEVRAALEHFEIVLSGSGGQGVILAGRILAEAASIYDKKEAVMTQSYGPEARGGASHAEIIISSCRIDYPKVISTNILLAMTQEALDKYAKLLNKDGLLIVDETLIKRIPINLKNVFKAPFSLLGIKLLDTPIVANIIALGSLASITGAVSREGLIQAMLDHVSEKLLVPDRIAVDMGFKLVKDSNFRWHRRGLGG